MHGRGPRDSLILSKDPTGAVCTDRTWTNNSSLTPSHPSKLVSIGVDEPGHHLTISLPLGVTQSGYVENRVPWLGRSGREGQR